MDRIELESLFNKDELFVLKKIGLEFCGDEINVLSQGKVQKRIRTYKINNINRISFYKTDRRQFSWLSIFNVFSQSIFVETEDHASRIFSLKIKLKNGAISQTDIKDFDLHKISRLLEKINTALKNNA